MKRIKVFFLSLAVAIFSMIGGSAFASPGDDGCVGNCGGGLPGVGGNQSQTQTQIGIQNTTISNRISNDTRSNAVAFSGGGDAKSSSQSSSGSNTLSNGGNSLTVNAAPIPTQTTTRIENSDYTVKNVPSVFSGNVYPTAPCMGSSSVGGAGVGFGFSVGTSWKDDECGIRETSRSFSGLGLKEDALAVLCTSEYAKAAPACRALAQPK